MSRVVVRGSAAVFHNDGRVVLPSVLRSLDGLAYGDERFTDYLGGPPEENELSAKLEPGGTLSFAYSEGADTLTALTVYRTRGPLTEVQLKLLVDYTMGQWSDGIGENWACRSSAACGYSIVCLTSGPPVVEVVAE